jgi:hypothetical protein
VRVLLGRERSILHGCRRGSRCSSAAGAPPTVTRALALGAKAGAWRLAFRAYEVLPPAIQMRARSAKQVSGPGRHVLPVILDSGTPAGATAYSGDRDSATIAFAFPPGRNRRSLRRRGGSRRRPHRASPQDRLRPRAGVRSLSSGRRRCMSVTCIATAPANSWRDR